MGRGGIGGLDTFNIRQTKLRMKEVAKAAQSQLEATHMLIVQQERTNELLEALLNRLPAEQLL